MNPDCYFGDHRWNGTSQCSCGARLRCVLCGCYVREDRLGQHIDARHEFAQGGDE